MNLWVQGQWLSKARIRKYWWLGCAMKSADQEVTGGEENGIEIKEWDCCTVLPSAAGAWVAFVQAKISVGQVKELSPDGYLCVRWLKCPCPCRAVCAGHILKCRAGSCLRFEAKLRKAGNPAILLANRWCSPADFLSWVGVWQQFQASPFLLLTPVNLFWTGLNFPIMKLRAGFWKLFRTGLID